jgi:AcrR family transcriptional regulator
VKAVRKSVSSADQLLVAAAALLGERPGLDVSLSDIAKRSGLNSALIKYYFGNKEGLLLALLERDAALAMEALDHLVAAPISAEQKLRIHISGIINTYYRSPYLNRLIHYMITSAGDAAAKRVAEIFIAPLLAAYRTIIDQGVAEGRFRPVDPALLYYSLVGSCDHLFFAAHSIPGALGEPHLTEELKQRYIAHVSEICLSGIASRER